MRRYTKANADYDKRRAFENPTTGPKPHYKVPPLADVLESELGPVTTSPCRMPDHGCEIDACATCDRSVWCGHGEPCNACQTIVPDYTLNENGFCRYCR